MNKANLAGAACCVAMVALSCSAAAQTVSSFTVVNADTGVDIATFTSGGNRRTENAAPCAYKGDSGSVYLKWLPAAGTDTINAQPFSGSSGSGTVSAAVNGLYFHSTRAFGGVGSRSETPFIVATDALRWFDPVNGQTADRTFAVGSDGLASFTKPASFGPELALHLRKQSSQESRP